MNTTEELIVPTQEIVFAVKKDGTVISNFVEKRGGVEEPNTKALMAYFEGLKNYLKTCPEKELLSYTFVELFENREVHRVITDRLESIKTKKDE